MENQNSALQVHPSPPEPVSGSRPTRKKQTLTVHVQPKSVEAIEELTFKTQIGNRADTTLISSRGKVEIRVPYDGTEFFETKEIEKAQKASLPSVVCGYVGMERPDAGPMDKPIKVPVEIWCDDLDQLVASGSEAMISVEYAVPEMAERLVYVDAMLMDDRWAARWEEISDSFTEHLGLRIRVECNTGNISQAAWQTILERVEQEKREAQKAYNQWKNLVELSKESPGFLTRLRAWFLGAPHGDVGSKEGVGEGVEAIQKALGDATDRLGRLVRLSESLKKIDPKRSQELTAEEVSEAITRAREEDKERISEETRHKLDELDRFVRSNLSGATLTYMGIEWPYAEQGLEIDGHSKWRYNPEMRRMEQWDIPMTWNHERRAYEVVLLLDLYRPAESFPIIRGQMVLETDKLVSGMQLCWIGSKGNVPRKPQFKCRTVFILDIEEIQLLEIFHQRRLFPRRQLVFKSVLPAIERIHEVENVLGDAGLTILDRSYGTDINSVDLNKGCWIEATQRQIGLPMKVWVVIHGTQKIGKYTVRYDTGRQYIETDVPLGDLQVGLFAQVIGSTSVVSEILDDLQFRLQRAFENVSSMV